MDVLSTLEYTEEKSLVVIVPFNYIALNTKYLIISILMVIIKLILNHYEGIFKHNDICKILNMLFIDKFWYLYFDNHLVYI